ncbi:hypothetical protein L7F22_056102 [Adiantum nelumboides]|nr:hypothetical protein [Adiantum nelumboides]
MMYMVPLVRRLNCFGGFDAAREDLPVSVSFPLSNNTTHVRQLAESSTLSNASAYLGQPGEAAGEIPPPSSNNTTHQRQLAESSAFPNATAYLGQPRDAAEEVPSVSVSSPLSINTHERQPGESSALPNGSAYLGQPGEAAGEVPPVSVSSPLSNNATHQRQLAESFALLNATTYLGQPGVHIDTTHQRQLADFSALSSVTTYLGQSDVHKDLLPGLPNSLVLEFILPHIPWYARPRLKATSKSWSNVLDALSPFDRHLARNVSETYRAYRGIDTSNGDMLQGSKISHSGGLRMWQGGMWKWEERRKICAKQRYQKPVWPSMLVQEGKLYILAYWIGDERIYVKRLYAKRSMTEVLTFDPYTGTWKDSNIFERERQPGYCDSRVFRRQSIATSMQDVDVGKIIDEDIVGEGLLKIDIVLGPAFVEMYARCGVLQKAQTVLKNMHKRARSTSS